MPKGMEMIYAAKSKALRVFRDAADDPSSYAALDLQRLQKCEWLMVHSPTTFDEVAKFYDRTFDNLRLSGYVIGD